MKPTKIFYRFQDKNGLGPYRRKHLDSWLFNYKTHNDNENHPDVSTEKLKYVKNRKLITYLKMNEEYGYEWKNVFFCFQSIPLLLSWFNYDELDRIFNKSLIDFYIIKSRIYTICHKQSVVHKDKFFVVDVIKTFNDFQKRFDLEVIEDGFKMLQYKGVIYDYRKSY